MTLECLQNQLLLACHGVRKLITDMQTQTGIKDKFTEYWIDRLLAKAVEMKNENPQESTQSNAIILKKWLDEQPGDKYNPLLSVAGECKCLLLLFS